MTYRLSLRAWMVFLLVMHHVPVKPRRISGRLRSETATRNRYAIRGYLDTARKQHQPVMDVIRDALAGVPWMPVIPA